MALKPHFHNGKVGGTLKGFLFLKTPRAQSEFRIGVNEPLLASSIFLEMMLFNSN
jgi:hypothetical protein